MCLVIANGKCASECKACVLIMNINICNLFWHELQFSNILINWRKSMQPAPTEPRALDDYQICSSCPINRRMKSFHIRKETRHGFSP